MVDSHAELGGKVGAIYGMKAGRLIYTEAAPDPADREAAQRMAEDRLERLGFDAVEVWDGVVLIVRLRRNVSER